MRPTRPAPPAPAGRRIRSALAIAVAGAVLATSACGSSSTHSAARSTARAVGATVTLPAITASTADKHYLKLEVDLLLTPGTQPSAVDPGAAADAIQTSLETASVGDMLRSSATAPQRLAAQFQAALAKPFAGRVQKVLVLQMISQ